MDHIHPVVSEVGVPLPPPVSEVSAPLHACIAPLLEAFQRACPTVPVLMTEASEFAIMACVGSLVPITCVRHCADPAHFCILISIGTTIIPYMDEEKTVDYIDRVVKVLIDQLNLLELFTVFGGLHTFITLYVVTEKGKIQIMDGDFTPGSRTATIQDGSLVHCDIEFRKDGQQNPALMALYLKMIETLSSAKTAYVRILGTRNGFVGFHDHGGEKFVSLSNYQGVSTTLGANGFRLVDIENFCRNPTDELVVIHTTGTPYDGVIGLKESSCATIKVGKEVHTIPSGQWSFLKNIIKMF